MSKMKGFVFLNAGGPPVRRQRPESLQQHGRRALQPRPLAVATADVAVGGSDKHIVSVFRVFFGVLRGQRGLRWRVRVCCRVWRRAGPQPPRQRVVVLDRRLCFVLVLLKAGKPALMARYITGGRFKAVSSSRRPWSTLWQPGHTSGRKPAACLRKLCACCPSSRSRAAAMVADR